MTNFANRLAELLLKRTGYIANVWTLPLELGAILAKRGGEMTVVGRLDDRIRNMGKPELAEKIRAIIERSAQAGTTTLSLKYHSEGTTMISFDGAGDVELPNPTGGAPIKVKLSGLVSFSQATDYLFDATEPCPWRTFATADADDVLDAAMAHLKRREFLVTGVAQAKKWLWYISRTRDSVLGFGASAELPGGLDFAKLAEVAVTGSLSVKYRRGEVVPGGSENSVAMFKCLVKRKPLFGSGNMGPARIEMLDSATGETTVVKEFDVLDDAYPEDIAEDSLGADAT